MIAHADVALLSSLVLALWLDGAEVIEADMCIYGGTAGGVAAAVQAARMGKTAVIAEFGNHLGGMTSGGLGATDIGNKAAIGGIAREFYHRVALHYATDERLAVRDAARTISRKRGGRSTHWRAERARRPRCGPSSRTWPRTSSSRCSTRPRWRSISSSAWLRCKKEGGAHHGDRDGERQGLSRRDVH